MSIRLVVMGPGGEGGSGSRVLNLALPVITVGRSSDNHVVILDTRVSSRHGRLIRRGERYLYEDLGSRNGTMLEREGTRVVVTAGQVVQVGPGDRLLLGDRLSPVAVHLDQAPLSVAPGSLPDGDGASIVASFSVGQGREILGGVDLETLRNLFSLLHDLSGTMEPGVLLAHLAQAMEERFAALRSITIHLMDPEGRLVPEFHRAFQGDHESGQSGESGGGAPRIPEPSRTLLARAMERSEVVVYGAGAEVDDGASLAGLAGAAVVPLVASDGVMGVLHLESTRRPFVSRDIAWLSIVGTHVTASLVCARRFADLTQSETTLRKENRQLRARSPLLLERPMVGQSEAIKGMLYQLDQVAETSATVLLTGETGTGKELAARYLHVRSLRRDRPFLAVNCSALPDNLLESELFGYKKGAFTGANTDREGVFQAARGGTVFLDEIGDISEDLQLKLLRVLQEGEVKPIGSPHALSVDFRVVAATNRDLKEAVQEGNFRTDLYFRLHVFPVHLPPLRERSGDVDLLSEHFRQSICSRHNKPVLGFSEEAMEVLRFYHWPGNIRELEHSIERAVILAPAGGLLTVRHFGSILGDREGEISSDATLLGETGPTFEALRTDTLLPGTMSQAGGGRDGSHQRPESCGPAALPQGTLKEIMEEMEERVVRRALAENGNNRTRAAAALGISRQALQAKVARMREAGTL